MTLEQENKILKDGLQAIIEMRPVCGMNPNAKVSEPHEMKVGWNVHWLAQAILKKASEK